MWFRQTGLNVNRFETGLSTSVNGAYMYVYALYVFKNHAVLWNDFPTTQVTYIRTSAKVSHQ